MAQLSPKDPDSTEYFVWDFTQMILSGAGGSIASVVAGPIEEEGDGAVTILVGSAIDSTRMRVSALLSGGTGDTQYTFTMRVLTTEGEQLDHSLSFYVVNAVT